MPNPSVVSHDHLLRYCYSSQASIALVFPLLRPSNKWACPPLFFLVYPPPKPLMGFWYPLSGYCQRHIFELSIIVTGKVLNIKIYPFQHVKTSRLLSNLVWYISKQWTLWKALSHLLRCIVFFLSFYRRLTEYKRHFSLFFFFFYFFLHFFFSLNLKEAKV